MQSSERYGLVGATNARACNGHCRCRRRSREASCAREAPPVDRSDQRHAVDNRDRHDRHRPALVSRRYPAPPGVPRTLWGESGFASHDSSAEGHSHHRRFRNRPRWGLMPLHRIALRGALRCPWGRGRSRWTRASHRRCLRRDSSGTGVHVAGAHVIARSVADIR